MPPCDVLGVGGRAARGQHREVGARRCAPAHRRGVRGRIHNSPAPVAVLGAGMRDDNENVGTTRGVGGEFQRRQTSERVVASEARTDGRALALIHFHTNGEC